MMAFRGGFEVSTLRVRWRKSCPAMNGDSNLVNSTTDSECFTKKKSKMVQVGGLV